MNIPTHHTTPRPTRGMSDGEIFANGKADLERAYRAGEREGARAWRALAVLASAVAVFAVVVGFYVA